MSRKIIGLLNIFRPGSVKMTIIRSAAKQDATAFLPLLKQLGYPQSLEEIENRIALFSEQDGYGIAGAERDKKIIACITWSTTMIFVSSKVIYLVLYTASYSSY